MRAGLLAVTFLGVAGVVCLWLGPGPAVFPPGERGAMAGPDLTRAVNLPSQPESNVRLAEGYGKLPLSFEANQGQVGSQVKFLSRGSGYTLFLNGDSAVLALRKSNSNGKGQMAKRKSEFQHSQFDAPSSLLEHPPSFQMPATDDGPRTTNAVVPGAMPDEQAFTLFCRPQ